MRHSFEVCWTRNVSKPRAAHVAASRGSKASSAFTQFETLTLDVVSAKTKENTNPVNVINEVRLCDAIQMAVNFQTKNRS